LISETINSAILTRFALPEGPAPRKIAIVWTDSDEIPALLDECDKDLPLSGAWRGPMPVNQVGCRDQHNLAEARSRRFPMRYANTAHHLQEQAAPAGLNDCEPCRRWERFDSFSARKLDGGAIEVLFKRDGKAVGREVSRLNAGQK
jgi:hypothetical protein